MSTLKDTVINGKLTLNDTGGGVVEDVYKELTDLITDHEDKFMTHEIYGPKYTDKGTSGAIWVIALNRIRICSFYIAVTNATGTWQDYVFADLVEKPSMNVYGVATEQYTGTSVVVGVAPDTTYLKYYAKGTAIPADAWLWGQVVYFI